MRAPHFQVVLPLVAALATTASAVMIASPLLYKIYAMAGDEARQAVGAQAERVASAVTHEVILLANRAMDLSRNVDFQNAVAGAGATRSAASYLQEFKRHNGEVRAAQVFTPDREGAIAAWPAAANQAAVPSAWRDVAAAIESWQPRHSSYQILILKDDRYLAALNQQLWGLAAAQRRLPQQSAYLMVLLLPVGAEPGNARAFLAFVVPLEDILQCHRHLVRPSGRLTFRLAGQDLFAQADGAPFLPQPGDWLTGTAEAAVTHVRGHEHFALGSVVAQPAELYLAEVRRTVYWVGCLACGLLLVTAAAAYVVAHYLVRPLRRLTAQAAAYSAGDYTNSAGRLPFAEWQALQVTMRDLGLKIQAQIEQAATSERLRGDLTRAKVEADLSVLRAQMQPHFMFNVLNNIRALIADDGPRAARMLGCLSDLYRLVVQASKHPMLSLEQEVAVVESYLALQSMRFEERLSYELVVPAAFRQLQVPSLVLQTLVENAVKHGIAKARAGGRIWLSAAGGAAGGCVVTIINTGAPLAAAYDPGVGLANTRRRLDLSFGADHGPDLWTDELGRTCVRIRVAERPA